MMTAQFLARDGNIKSNLIPFSVYEFQDVFDYQSTRPINIAGNGINRQTHVVDRVDPKISLYHHTLLENDGTTRRPPS